MESYRKIRHEVRWLLLLGEWRLKLILRWVGLHRPFLHGQNPGFSFYRESVSCNQILVETSLQKELNLD